MADIGEEKEATTNNAVEYDKKGEEKRAKNKRLIPKRSKLQQNL